MPTTYRLVHRRPKPYAAAKSLGFDIDYKNLLKTFRKQGRLIRAYYYTALAEDQEYSPIRPLIDWLDYNGYTMVTKPAKEYTDSTGRPRYKGNISIELAVDMMEMAPTSTTRFCFRAMAISASCWKPFNVAAYALP